MPRDFLFKRIRSVPDRPLPPDPSPSLTKVEIAEWLKTACTVTKYDHGALWDDTWRYNNLWDNDDDG